jgi:transposase-like protein
MEGKFKHNKNGKFESRYSEEFQRKVIEEYLETGTPKQHLLDKYGITYKGAFQAWIPHLRKVSRRGPCASTPHCPALPWSSFRARIILDRTKGMPAVRGLVPV